MTAPFIPRAFSQPGGGSGQDSENLNESQRAQQRIDGNGEEDHGRTLADGPLEPQSQFFTSDRPPLFALEQPVDLLFQLGDHDVAIDDFPLGIEQDHRRQRQHPQLFS